MKSVWEEKDVEIGLCVSCKRGDKYQCPRIIGFTTGAETVYGLTDLSDGMFTPIGTKAALAKHLTMYDFILVNKSILPTDEGVKFENRLRLPFVRITNSVY